MSFFGEFGCMGIGGRDRSHQSPTHQVPNPNVARNEYPISQRVSARTSPRQHGVYAHVNGVPCNAMPPPPYAHLSSAVGPRPPMMVDPNSQAFYNGHPANCTGTCCQGLPRVPSHRTNSLRREPEPHVPSLRPEMAPQGYAWEHPGAQAASPPLPIPQYLPAVTPPTNLPPPPPSTLVPPQQMPGVGALRAQEYPNSMNIGVSPPCGVPQTEPAMEWASPKSHNPLIDPLPVPMIRPTRISQDMSSNTESFATHSQDCLRADSPHEPPKLTSSQPQSVPSSNAVEASSPPPPVQRKAALRSHSRMKPVSLTIPSTLGAPPSPKPAARPVEPVQPAPQPPVVEESIERPDTRVEHESQPPERSFYSKISNLPLTTKPHDSPRLPKSWDCLAASGEMSRPAAAVKPAKPESREPEPSESEAEPESLSEPKEEAEDDDATPVRGKPTGRSVEDEALERAVELEKARRSVQRGAGFATVMRYSPSSAEDSERLGVAEMLEVPRVRNSALGSEEAKILEEIAALEWAEMKRRAEKEEAYRKAFDYVRSLSSEIELPPQVPKELKKDVERLRASNPPAQLLPEMYRDGWGGTQPCPVLQPVRNQAARGFLKHQLKLNDDALRLKLPAYVPMMSPTEMSVSAFYGGRIPDPNTERSEGPSFTQLLVKPPLSDTEKVLLMWYEDFFMKNEAAFLELGIVLTSDFNSLEDDTCPMNCDLIDLCKLLYTLVPRARMSYRKYRPTINAPPHAYLANEWLKFIAMYIVTDDLRHIDYSGAKDMIEYIKQFCGAPMTHFVIDGTQEFTYPITPVRITEAFFGTDFLGTLYPLIDLGYRRCGVVSIEQAIQSDELGCQCLRARPADDGQQLYGPHRAVGLTRPNLNKRHAPVKESRLGDLVVQPNPSRPRNPGPVRNTNEANTESSQWTDTDASCTSNSEPPSSSLPQNPKEVTTVASSNEAVDDAPFSTKNVNRQLPLRSDGVRPSVVSAGISKFERGPTKDCPAWSPKNRSRVASSSGSGSANLGDPSSPAARNRCPPGRASSGSTPQVPPMDPVEDRGRARAQLRECLPSIHTLFTKLEERLYAVLQNTSALQRLRHNLKSLPPSPEEPPSDDADDSSPLEQPAAAGTRNKRPALWKQYGPSDARKAIDALRNEAIELLPRGSVVCYVRVVEKPHHAPSPVVFKIFLHDDVQQVLGDNAFPKLAHHCQPTISVAGPEDFLKWFEAHRYCTQTQ